MSLFTFINLIFTANALNFEYALRNGINTKISMDECDNHWIIGLHLTKPAQCKLSADIGGYYGLNTFEDLQKVTLIQKTAFVNVSLQANSTIQLLLPSGNYQIMVNRNITIMHIYLLEKLHEIKMLHKNALSILGEEYMMIKKCQIQKLLPQQQQLRGKASKVVNKQSDESKSKAKFVWTEKDKDIMKAQALKFEELAAMHSNAAALFEAKEKRFFV